MAATGRSAEQRRGRRYRQRLAVDLHSQRSAKRLWTHDVGAHGLFLLMNEPPRERHVLKLTIHLPEGPIAAVAHGTHTSNRGMGVQFFALAGEAKRRWDAFVGALSGLPPAEGLDATAFGDATFVVKLRTTDALHDFARHCLEAGGTYLRTPVLKAVGSSVTLAMVHPTSERELPLAGVVARLHQQRPKGMEIQFSPATLALKETFARFLATGEPPEIDVDQDADLVLEVSDERPPPTFDDTFDIDVLADAALELAPLDDEHRFDWDQVSEELLIDIGLGDELDTFEPPSTDPNLRFEGRQEPLPPSQEGEPLPAGLDDLARPGFQVLVRCDACDMLETELDVGRVPGALGLVAEHQPLFCPSCRTLATAKRLLSAEQRASVRTTLRERAELEVHVPVRVLLDVGDLIASPSCPTCKAPLERTPAVQALEVALAALEQGREPSTRLSCGVCETGAWTVERVEPPLRIDV